MNKKYIIFGIVLIVLAFFSATLFAAPIDLINVSFEKTSYSMMDNGSLKINYTLENNNSSIQNILVYTECDEDELICDFSKTFKLNAYSSIQSSFTIQAIDDGSSNIKFYVKDMKTNDVKSYLLRIDIDNQTDEGKFEASLSRYSYCNNSSQEIALIFDDVSSNGFYNLSLSSNTIVANIKGSNQKYLKDDIEIPLQIETFNSSTGNHKIILNISNDILISKKVFEVYVSECQEVLKPDFTVTGGQATTHVLKKEVPYTLKYTIKNISNKNKHIFISQESQDILDITFSNRELRLSPGEVKEVTLNFYASKDIKSGDYPVTLSFFDERTTITRNLKFLLSPESNLEVRLLQSSALLEIGKTYNITAVIENNGDVLETIYFDFDLSNDIKVNNMTERVTVSPHTKTTVSFNISAGVNTLEKNTQISLIARNSSNDYSKRFNLDVVTFRQRDIFKIDFLSFPTELSVDVNGTKNFSFDVYNFDDRDIVISRIDITGLGQDISYEITQYTYIPSKTSRTISGKIIIGNIPVQEYNANIIFYSNSGAVLSKPVLLKVTDAQVEYEDEGKTPITGFFTLGKSIMLGIIFLALLLIVLLIAGVIRTKHKNYVRN